MKAILYSTNCPKCQVLEKKLTSSGIEYEVCDDVDVMQKNGFQSVPMLVVDGKTLDFMEAVNWVNEKAGI
jgi:glutaredoxin